MKKIFISLLLLVGLTITVGAKDYIAPTKQSVEFTDSTTTDNYIIDGERYNIYKSSKGAFYFWKVSKRTGKKYKMYLPKEIQQRLGRVYIEKK